MPSATIAVHDVTSAQPEELFSAEGAKRIYRRSAGEPAQCWRS